MSHIVKIENLALAALYEDISDPLSAYMPYSKQIEMHELTTHKSLFLAGNGSGKTYLGVHEFCMALTGRHWVKGKYPKPPIDARICAEKKALTGVGASAMTIIPLLKRILKPFLVKGYPKKGGTSLESDWLLTNGSSFDVLTYDQDDDKFESVSKDLIWFDEPFPKSIYDASIARMRKGKGGKIFFTLTPLFRAAWMYEKFVGSVGENDDVGLVYAELWDNCKCLYPEDHDRYTNTQDVEGHCVCNKGYVHKEAIEKMIAEWDDDVCDARIRGQFITMRDLVFKEFDPHSHIMDEEDLTRKWVEDNEIQLFAVVDPHSRRPPAWGLYGWDRDDVLYVIDEFPNYFDGMYKGKFFDQIKDFHLDYPGVIRIFQEIESKYGRVEKRYIDPRFAMNRLANTSRTVLEELHNAADDLGVSMRFKKAKVGRDLGDGEIISGVNIIKGLLKFDKDRDIGIGNMPGLMISSRCVNHIRMFQYFKYTLNTGRQAETKYASETMTEKFKDWCDLLRYLVKSVPGYKRRVVKEAYTYKPYSDYTGF
jgi:phage terminase large subunit-like protein